MERKLEVYKRQVKNFRHQFPDHEYGLHSKACYFVFQAAARLWSTGFWRKTAESAESWLTRVVSGVLANSREARDAEDALDLLDQAIDIYDLPFAYLFQADILCWLKRDGEALEVLNYVIRHFPETPEYIEARQKKDDILASE